MTIVLNRSPQITFDSFLFFQFLQYIYLLKLSVSQYIGLQSADYETKNSRLKMKETVKQ